MLGLRVFVHFAAFSRGIGYLTETNFPGSGARHGGRMLAALWPDWIVALTRDDAAGLSRRPDAERYLRGDPKESSEPLGAFREFLHDTSSPPGSRLPARPLPASTAQKIPSPD